MCGLQTSFFIVTCAFYVFVLVPSEGSFDFGRKALRTALYDTKEKTEVHSDIPDDLQFMCRLSHPHHKTISCISVLVHPEWAFAPATCLIPFLDESDLVGPTLTCLTNKTLRHGDNRVFQVLQVVHYSTNNSSVNHNSNWNNDFVGLRLDKYASGTLAVLNATCSNPLEDEDYDENLVKQMFNHILNGTGTSTAPSSSRTNIITHTLNSSALGMPLFSTTTKLTNESSSLPSTNLPTFYGICTNCSVNRSENGTRKCYCPRATLTWSNYPTKVLFNIELLHCPKTVSSIEHQNETYLMQNIKEEVKSDNLASLRKYFCSEEYGPNLVDANGNTSLHYAAIHDSHRAAEMLCQLNAGLELKNKLNRTSLYESVGRGSIKVIKVLLKYGANVNSQNGKNMTPLMKSMHRRSIQIAETLIESKANVDAQNRQGRTALHIASMHCKPDMVKLLLHHKAQTNIENNVHRLASQRICLKGAGNEKTSNCLRIKELFEMAGLEVDKISGPCIPN